MEMVEVANMSYRDIFLTKYDAECEHFLGKETDNSPVSLVSGTSSLVYFIFILCTIM